MQQGSRDSAGLQGSSSYYESNGLQVISYKYFTYEIINPAQPRDARSFLVIAYNLDGGIANQSSPKPRC